MNPSPASLATTPAPPIRPTLGAVYYSEHGYVARYLRRLGVPSRDLADVVQEVFVVVHQKLDTYDTSRPLRAWLFGLAFRVASHYFRSAGRRQRAMAALESEVAPPSAGTPTGRKLLEQALDLLSEEQRVVFVMVELEDMAIPEIAEVLEIPTNTAYSRLRLAREKFAAFAEKIEEEAR